MKRSRSTSKSKTPGKPEAVAPSGNEARSSEPMSRMPASARETSNDEQTTSENPSSRPEILGSGGRNEPRTRGQDLEPQQVERTTTQSPEVGSETKSTREAEDPESRRRRIAERAYTIYERGGRVEGKALDHWLEAERELAHAAEPGSHQWDH
jgi:hypothetical protein